MRRYRNWWRSGLVVNGLVVLLAATPGFAVTFTPAETSSAKSQATTGAGAVNQKLGSSEGLNTNAAQPLTSGDKPLSSVDGSVTGSAQMSQASSKAFLEMFIKPGTSGDLQLMVVSQDLDLNGVFDTTYNAPGPVSGVCSNGYVSCSPGTWNNCVYLLWKVEPDGKVKAEPAAISEVSGCYCINNSCGSNLVWNNLGLVLNNLGGGAAGAVVQGNPNLQISQTSADPATMKVLFYGQDLSSNRTMADGSKVATATVPETGYYARPGQAPAQDMNLATQGAVTSQQVDTGSYYSMMRGVSQNIGTNSSLQTCQQTRNLAFSSVQILKNDPYPPGAVLREQPVNEYYRVYSHFTTTKDDCRIGKNPSAHPSYHWKPTDGPLYDTAAVPPNATDTGEVNYTYLGCKKKSGTDVGSYDVYKIWLVESKKLDMAAETITDNCSALASDSNCTLWAEKVDGVEVFRNGGSTGLVPQPAPRTFTGQLQSYTVVRDWWNKDRTYRCTSTTGPYDFKEPLKRIKTISDSANKTPNQGTSITYEDTRQGINIQTRTLDGAWVGGGGVISLPPPDPTTDCIQMCKTKKPVIGTDLTLSSTVDQERADNTGGNPLAANQQWKFFYKECEAAGCPTEAGETIEKNCQCLNDFAEATAVIETLNRAGKDIICTDGVRK